MRRRTIRVLALVLTLVMLVCQAGLTVRGTAGTGRLMSAGEDAGLSAAEGSTPEDQPGGGILETDTAAAPEESSAPGTQGSDTQPEESQPEDGGDPSGDAVLQGSEPTAEPEQDAPQGWPGAEDGPWFEGQMTPAPTETAEPTAEPEATAEPDGGTPFGEGMIAFYGEDSEAEALAYLWSLAGGEQGDMPLGDDPGIMPILESSEKVPSGFFRFAVYGANESGTPTTYTDFNDLKTKRSDVTTVEWPGPNGGDLQGTGGDETLASYPKITGYKISSIRLNGTIIYHLGMYEVNETQYVHFSAVDTQGRMTTAVLTNQDPEDYGATPPFEVRYVPDEYKITYEVYEGENLSTKYTVNEIFGENAAKTTVNHWASVDVTIPAGYTGQVYIGDTDELTSTDTYKKFPQEGGRYPLGEEPKYTYNEASNTIDIDPNGPSVYTITGTYLVGSAEDKVKEAQTVRVVLTKKESITFHADVWQNYQIGDTPTSNKVNVDDWTATGILDETTGYATITWTFAMITYQDKNNNSITDAEMRTLEINGASIPVPFVSATRTNAEKTATLPSGAEVTITATWTSDDHPSYTISITKATRDIWITGGSMNTNDSTYKELIVSGLYGLEDPQIWANNDGNGEWTDMAAGKTLNTGYYWNAGNHSYEDVAAFGDAGFKYRLTGSSEDTASSLYGNVRFKLQEGFTFSSGDNDPNGTAEKPTVRLIDKDDGVQNASAGTATHSVTVSGPDNAGYYYVTLVSPYGNDAQPTETMNAYMLEVRAYPEQYVIAYQDGVSVGNGGGLNPGIAGNVLSMPDYSESNGEDVPNNVDTNRGSYYALAAGDGSYTGGDASDSVTVSEASPTIDREGEREVTFLGWVLTNAAGEPYEWEDTNGGGITIADKVTGNKTTAGSGKYPIIQPTDLLELRNIMDASTAGADTPTEFTIYLTALWSDPAPAYTYYVTFNYTDPAGQEHRRVSGQVTVGSQTYGNNPFDASDTTDFTPALGDNQYYVAKRQTYFDLGDLGGLSIVFDPETYHADGTYNISIDELSSQWQWYKYDKKNNGSDGDPYKWTGVNNNGEVDVWFISTLG